MFNPKWITYHIYRTHQFKIFSLVLMPLTLGLLIAGFTTEPEPKNTNLTTDMALDSLLSVAHRLQGVPYKAAGKNEAGFDCSGYTRFVYDRVGVKLNASAASQFGQGTEVHPDSLRQGDLLFFQNSGGRIFHVGLYVGEEEERRAFIHASSSRGIVKDYLEMDYFARRWAGAKRIIP